MVKTSIIGTLLVMAGILMGAVVWEGGPDAVIFPPQKVPIYFTHDYHTRKPSAHDQRQGEGLACEFCHEKISESSEARDRDIPGHDDCDSCHAEWIGDASHPAPVAECARCHRDLSGPNAVEKASPLLIPNPNIKFPHALHVKDGIECTGCHVNVPKKTVATRDDYPTMDRCVACHEEKGVSTACSTCHLTGASGRVVTDYPEGRLEPRRYHSFAIHDADFLRDHGVPAKRDKGYCRQCHAESDCLECHDGVARDVRYHPGDWISAHVVRAKKDDFQCQSCHRTQSFCLDCHVRSGVATVGREAVVANLPALYGSEAVPGRRTIRVDAQGIATGPHPMAASGWYDPQSRNFHGFYAQRNIRSCASCHQEQLCITCHASGFGRTQLFRGLFRIGGNPHGPEPEKLRGSTARRRNARMCLKCHSPGDPSWR